MAGKLGAFQTRKMNYVNGMVKENHIGAMFQKSPQKAPWAMVQLLERKFGKSWESFFMKYPIKYFPNHEKYYWDVVGDSRRNIPVVEVRDIANTKIESGIVGANYEPFYIVFNEDYFHKGEVIYGEKNEKGAILRIRSEKPVMEGRNARYEVECFGAKLQNGVKYDDVKAGQRFSYGPAYVSETLSREVGDLGYETPMNMTNNWSTVRIKTKVPGGMEDVELACGMPYIDKSGKKAVATYWMQYVDYKLEAKFSDYKNLAIAYGVSTELEDGSYSNIDFSGEPIKTGSGLLDQMDVNGVKYYNDFSLDMITNALYQLSSNKIGLDENRTFVISCGEAAAIDFHKAIMTEASGWHLFDIEGTSLDIIKKVPNSKLHQNALSAGFQFVEYLAPNNVKVRLQIDQWKDDPVVNKIMWKGAPAMSRRMDILYVGSEDQPNIQICRVEGADEYRGYQWGLRNSFTKATMNGNMSYDEDSTTIHKMSNQFGIAILDPTRTISFVPDVLRGY